jgi:predicted transposase/invertase (TIGR01784 family)
MAERTLMSFDWAIKKVLRHKENFDVLEGFLSELLGFDVVIVNLLESEGNQQSEKDKFDRVDILVQTTERELMLIEIQYDDEIDYFHRMVYGVSKLITEYIHEGQSYGEIKKVYSINIVYFRIGQGKDYIYEYQGAFIGRKQKDILNPTKTQQKKYTIKKVADIFPKYYILRVGAFKPEQVVEPIDEWFYFLKKSEIKDSFQAKGMKRAKTVLDVERMSLEERRAYQRHVENRRIEMSVTETAFEKGAEKGARQNSIDIAQKSLQMGLSPEIIAQLTALSLVEIALLAEGKSIDFSTEDE